jgi:hypothetical protein
VQVEHEVDQRSLESGAGAEVDGESSPGQLGRSVEIEDAELRADFPMRPRCEGQ